MEPQRKEPQPNSVHDIQPSFPFSKNLFILCTLVTVPLPPDSFTQSACLFNSTGSQSVPIVQDTRFSQHLFANKYSVTSLTSTLTYYPPTCNIYWDLFLILHHITEIIHLNINCISFENCVDWPCSGQLISHKSQANLIWISDKIKEIPIIYSSTEERDWYPSPVDQSVLVVLDHKSFCCNSNKTIWEQ